MTRRMQFGVAERHMCSPRTRHKPGRSIAVMRFWKSRGYQAGRGRDLAEYQRPGKTTTLGFAGRVDLDTSIEGVSLISTSNLSRRRSRKRFSVVMPK